MHCPECVKLGLKSRLYEIRAPSSPGPVERFWDEDGIKHVHDRTLYRVVYTCTQGHSFKREWMSRCPAAPCEWNEQEKVEGQFGPSGASLGQERIAPTEIPPLGRPLVR